MNVAALRSHLRDLSGFLDAAGATKKVTDDLRGAADGLAPFDGYKLTEFVAFLGRAEEFVRTGQLPVTGKPKAAAKPKAVPVNAQEARDRVVSLHDRAASATDEQIAEAMAPLAKLKKADLEPIAAAIGLRGKLTVKAMLAEIERIIRDRRGIAERSEY